MGSYHDHHHFELNKALHSKMSKIYIFQALYTFAKSLIGVFVPVYLYKLGFGIIDIMSYLIGVSLIYLILIPISIKVIKQIGFKYTLLFSISFYIMHIIVLNYVIIGSLYFHLTWVFYGFYVSFFWPTFHSEMALNGSNKHRSSQIGTIQIITTIFGTAAPIVGGIILEISTYTYLLIFTSILIFIGMVPLLYAQDIKLKHYNFNYKDYMRLFNMRNRKYSKLAFSAEGFNSVLLLTIWPIVIFIFLNQNFFKFGALLTIVSFISVIFILYAKSYFDKKNKKELLKRISNFVSINWFLKSFIIFFGIIFLYIIESIAKLTLTIFQILYSSIFYNNAKKTGYMDYIIFRELYLHISKIIFAISIIIIIMIIGENLILLNSIALIGIFVYAKMGLLKEEI